MLHFVLITTGTGSLLFEKVWQRGTGEQKGSNMLASLFTTMEEFCKQSTGLFVTYMEFTAGAITIVNDEFTNVRCILHHDRDEGPEFGRLVASQILKGFLETYGEIDFSHPQNASKFALFTNKLVEVISQSVRAILQQLIVKNNRGISNAIVIYPDGLTHSTGNAIDDQLGLIANLQAMLTFANDLLLLSKGDTPRTITLDLARQTVIIHRVAHASLVCVCRKNRDPATMRDKITSSVSLLEKLFSLQGDYGR
eukprot:TRINITY_DN3828_c0_g1_i1.p1 TRINITY_DN3828_c0_g1~~TRINITY_DN3828_c0_g1_i1.p1  ORF type:complete len:253 (-),score=58.35 TRINITY_DN3828_c0_g1_i1:209-967(-)